MKNQVLKTWVLLLAIAGGSVYVWHASQRKKPQAAAQQMENKATEQPGQGERVKILVTDEEVRATRESMMSTSKSGLIISEEDTRKMLEQRKKQIPQANDLAPSSKSLRIVSPEETRELTEKLTPSQQGSQPSNEQK